jgi:hypothetical protein
MNNFKTIELSDGSEYACNKEREGVFERRNDGTWQQLTGTGQTPRFQSAAHFRRWLSNRYIQVGEGLRMVGSSNW